MKLATAAKSCKKLTDLWNLNVRSPESQPKERSAVVVEQLSPKKPAEMRDNNAMKTFRKHSPPKKKASKSSPTLNLSVGLQKKRLKEMASNDIVVLVEKLTFKNVTSSPVRPTKIPHVRSKENLDCSTKTPVSSSKNTCLKEVNRVDEINLDKKSKGDNSQQKKAINKPKIFEISDDKISPELQRNLNLEPDVSITEELQAKNEICLISPIKNGNLTVPEIYIPQNQLPSPSPINCSIPDETFGDALAIYVFVETYNKLLHVRKHFKRKFTLQTVQMILLDTDLRGPLFTFLEMLIEAYYSIRDMTHSESVIPNGKLIFWKDVVKLPRDPYIISEIVRIHLLLGVSNRSEGVVFKYFSRISSRLNHRSVFELPSRERAVVIKGLIEAFISLPSFGKVTSEIRETVGNAVSELKNVRKLCYQSRPNLKVLQKLAKLQVVKDAFPVDPLMDGNGILGELNVTKRARTLQNTLISDPPEVRTDEINKSQDQETLNKHMIEQQIKKIQEKGVSNVFDECEKKLGEILEKVRVSVSLGSDRDYSRYWLIKSIPCILVEKELTHESKTVECDSGKFNTSAVHSQEDSMLKHQKWFFYSEKIALDMLTQSLDNNLYQELNLKRNIVFEANFLKQLMLDSEDNLWANILEDPTCEFGTGTETKLEKMDDSLKLLESMMIESLISLHEKLKAGWMGGMSCDIEESWRDALQNQEYEKLVDQKSDASTPVSSIMAYASVLLKLKGTIHRGFFKKYFHAPVIYRQLFSVYNDGWSNYVQTAKNISQLFLALCLLKRGIRWNKSLTRSRCRVCNRLDREARMILCNMCDNGFHVTCTNSSLEMSVDDLWFCKTCNLQRQKGEKKKEACAKCNRKCHRITCCNCYSRITLSCMHCDYHIWPNHIKCYVCEFNTTVPKRSEIECPRENRLERSNTRSLRRNTRSQRSPVSQRKSSSIREMRKSTLDSPTARNLRYSKRIAMRRLESENEEEKDDMPIKRKRSSRKINGSQEIQKILDDENSNSDFSNTSVSNRH